MTFPAILSIHATLTPLGEKPLSGTLKRISMTRAIVTCDAHLPRESFCDLSFKPRDQEQSIHMMCKVEENVHAATGVDVYLKIDRSLAARGTPA